MSAVEESAPARSVCERIGLTRGRLLAALCLALVAGSLAPGMAASLKSAGAAAWLGGAGVSWAVWLGLAAAVRLALSAEPKPATRGDLATGALCLLLLAAPQHYLVDVAASLLALWFGLAAAGDPRLRSAAMILGALIFSTFWAGQLLVMFALPIASLDAWMVGLAVGTPVHGNVVPMLDGHTYLIGSPCTSVRNASLAILLFVSITRSLRPTGGASYWLMLVAVFASAVLVNVIRLTLMAQSLPLLRYLHDGAGAAWVATAVTLTGLGWATLAVRREIFR